MTVGANVSVIHQSNAGLGDTTIVRTRGLLSAHAGGSIITDLGMDGAWGIGIVSAQAFAAGAASIPGAYTNADWDGWFAHGFWSFFQNAAGTPNNLVMSSVQMEWDSKAMRKVKDTDVVVVMAESQSAAVQVSLQFRMLIKLP